MPSYSSNHPQSQEKQKLSSSSLPSSFSKTPVDAADIKPTASPPAVSSSNNNNDSSISTHIQSPDIIAHETPFSASPTPDTGLDDHPSNTAISATDNDSQDEKPASIQQNSLKNGSHRLPKRAFSTSTAPVTYSKRRRVSSTSSSTPPAPLRRSSRRSTASQVDYSPQGLERQRTKLKNPQPLPPQHPSSHTQTVRTRRSSIKQEEQPIVSANETHPTRAQARGRKNSRSESLNGSAKHVNGTKQQPPHSRRVGSTAASSSHSPTPEPATASNEQLELASRIQQKKQYLSEVYDRHDFRVRLLFHLEKFVSLVSFDPEVAKQDHSSVFEEYRQKYDLWAKVEANDTSSRRSRASRRRTHLQKDALNIISPAHSPASSAIVEIKKEDEVAPRHTTRRSASARSESPPRSTPSTRKRGAPATSKPKVEHKTRSSAAANSENSTPPPQQQPQSLINHPQVGSKNISGLMSDYGLEDDDVIDVIGGNASSSEGYISDDFDEILFLNSSSESSLEDPHVSSESEIELNNESEIEPSSTQQYTPHLKIKFSLPDATITHPGHIAVPRFDSLDKYLHSFVSLDEDISEQQREEYIQDQAKLRNRIEEVKASGMYDIYLEHLMEHAPGSNSAGGSGGSNLTGNNSSSGGGNNAGTGGIGTATSTALSSAPLTIKSASSLISKLRRTFQDPIRLTQQPSHQDHLVSQAVYFSKLLSNERRSHISKSKKVAAMVEQYFKRLSNAEEKERKQEETRIRKLARKTALEVMRKWKIAEKVVLHRRAKKLEDEERQAGKKQLNMILEHSAQLLEARVSTNADASKKAVDEDEDDLMSASDADAEAEEVLEGHDEEEEDTPMEDALEETPDDEVSRLRNIPDDQLTVEELRQKYAALPDIKLNWDHSEEKEENENSDVEPENPIFEDEERVKKAIQMDKDVEASDSDHSTVMDSEEDDDDEMEDSELSQSEDEEENAASLSDLFKGDANETKASEVEEKDTEETKAKVKEPKEEETEEKKTKDMDKITLENDEAKTKDNPDKSTSELIKSSRPATSSPQLPPTTELVKTPIPFLLRGSLREYQHYGLDWLVGLYNNNTNGILADEMGLGKTIQTISLISYLACEKHVWGPHLIVVPTSVMLNWEMEFKRFAPGFKVLTYYGNPMQRKQKRQGWNKEDTWHVCITSYQLVLQDQNAFKRKKWHYMILDEAHNIKNFRSQRWQSLLNFNTEHRLLLTGTPLQNNLIELWSLLYFLMPSSRASQTMPEGFANLRNFQEWFSRPVEKMVEGGNYVDEEVKETVSKLHQILRPFLLRRLKADVEKQMPAKYEHVVYCKLSKRQRFLYDDFMSRAQTRETLASGNFLSIINCLMQLRKVCNHPDLFEVRPIVTSMAVNRSVVADFEIKDLLIRKRLVDDISESSQKNINLDFLNLKFTQNDFNRTTGEAIATSRWGNSKRPLIQEILSDQQQEVTKLQETTPRDLSSINGHLQYMNLVEKQDELINLESVIYQSHNKCERKPMYGADLIEKLSSVVSRPRPARGYDWNKSNIISSMMLNYEEQEAVMSDVIERYAFVTPKVVCLDMPRQVLGPKISELLSTMPANEPVVAMDEASHLNLVLDGKNNDVSLPQSLWMTPDLKAIQSQTLFHQTLVKLSIAFPDKRLLQFDCGKLQRLAALLHDLIANGHRALIFTQMTRVLDILEQFLNLHGWRYLRLDGATRIEQRQILTERFNQDPKIPIFILSTRSGGLGINLTGADTVIFYDSDWNPSMDKQCQDRCHRIGQTRDVHIYRLVSEYTIESNILRKAQQKQMLDNVVIQEGEFTTDYFTKLSVRDMLGDESLGGHSDEAVLSNSSRNLETILAAAEDDEDAKAAAAAMKEISNLDEEDFGESQRQQQQKDRASSVGTEVARGSTRISTPASDEGLAPSTRDTSTTPGHATEEQAEDEGEDQEEEEEEEDDEIEGINSIDDYMIRFIENGYYWD